MKKRILGSLITMGLAATLVGGATFAYFNDTVTNSNNQFTSGTLILDEASTAALATKNNIKPGDSDTDTITLTNGTSTLNSDVTAAISLTAGSSTDLAGNVYVTITYDGTAITADAGGDALDADSDGKISYAELAGKTLDLGEFAADDADKALSFAWNFEDTSADQNDLQGLSFTPELNIEAMQQ